MYRLLNGTDSSSRSFLIQFRVGITIALHPRSKDIAHELSIRMRWKRTLDIGQAVADVDELNAYITLNIGFHNPSFRIMGTT